MTINVFPSNSPKRRGRHKGVKNLPPSLRKLRDAVKNGKYITRAMKEEFKEDIKFLSFTDGLWFRWVTSCIGLDTSRMGISYMAPEYGLANEMQDWINSYGLSDRLEISVEQTETNSQGERYRPDIKVRDLQTRKTLTLCIKIPVSTVKGNTRTRKKENFGDAQVNHPKDKEFLNNWTISTFIHPNIGMLFSKKGEFKGYQEIPQETVWDSEQKARNRLSQGDITYDIMLPPENSVKTRDDIRRFLSKCDDSSDIFSNVNLSAVKAAFKKWIVNELAISLGAKSLSHK